MKKKNCKNRIKKDSNSSIKKIQELENKLKNAEEIINKLKYEKQRIEQITAISPSIITVYDYKNKKSTFQNKSLLKKLGYSDKEIEKYATGKLAIRNNLIHPEDVKKNDGSAYDFDKMKDGETYLLEFRIKDSKGNWQWIRKSSSVLNRDGKNKAAEIISSNDIITDLKEKEKEIENKKDEYKSLTENLPDLIARFDKNLRYLYISPNIKDITGISYEKVLGRTFGEVKIPKHLSEHWDIGIKKVFKSGKIQLIEFSYKSKREEVFFETRLIPEKDCKGKTKSVLAINRIITERKKAEKDIIRVQELLNKITSASPSIITVFDLNKKNSIFENKSILESLGYPASEFERIDALPHEERLNAIIHPEDLPKIKSFYKETRKIKDAQTHEMEFRIKDYRGNWNWFRRLTNVFTRNSRGSVEQIISIFENITKNKSSEETLKKSEEFNRAICQNAPIGISVRSASGKLLSYNEAWKKIWAKSDKCIFEDMSMKRKRMIFDESDGYLEKCQRKVKKIYEEGGELYIPELKTSITKKNKAEWVSNYFYAIKNPEGRVDRVVILTEDITERKKAEIELVETKQLLEKITAAAPQIIAVSDLSKGTNIYQNRSILEMLGYSVNEIRIIIKKEKNIYKYLIHPDDVNIIHAFDKEMDLFVDNKNYEIEYRLKDNRNNWQWIRRVCRVFQRDEKGTPSHIVSIFENINESKKAENALMESERTAQALLNTITETVFMQDTKGIILSMNDTAAQRFGKTKKELIGKCVYDLFPEQISQARKAGLKKVIETRNAVRMQDGREGKYYDTIGYPLFDAENKISKIIVFAKDITEQINTEKAIKESEERYKNLIETSPDGIIVHQDGRIIFANKSSAKILGYNNSGEMLNKKVMDFLHPDFTKYVLERINKIISKNENVPFLEEKFRKKDGSYIDVEVSALPYHFRGKTAVQVIARDISYRKEAEKALRVSEERYRRFIEKSTEGIYRLEFNKPIDITLNPVEQVRQIYKHCRFVECNDVIAAMYGFKKASELVGKKLYDLITEPGKPGDNKELLNFIASNYKTQNFETRESINGKTRYFINNAVGTVENGHLVRIWGTQTDSTELRERGEEIRKLSRAVNQSPASIVITDIKGNIEYVNPKFTEVTGYSSDEVIGQNPRILKSGDKSSEEYKNLWDTISSGNEWSGEFLNKRKNGEQFWESALITPIKTEKGIISNFLSIKQDITEQKKIDEKLKQSLKEKEVMLREIHHRVKNNLQIISSLLKLQSGYTKDPVASEYLKISQQRVKTMALIHQQLYRSKDLSGIDFKEYLNRLAKNLFTAYGINNNKITLDINAENILLSIDKAIPCGLIVNELVSNSLKHAFKKLHKGIIKIEIIKNDKEYVMTVSDNGNGIPENVYYRNTQSLGMQLVMTLVEQLDGIIKLDKKTGTKFIIAFPAIV